ncbi:DNA primase family protein [Paenibacillus chibensis]|uniref:DNA primase family protein n=1 Tax=Paenibacillus chibensis TaxID=59846 RepID=UPI000FD99BFB|nr:phage/plasmid primase, P4 family [Paenibacillus chibensis]MEC0369333.1 phage/plasmid primase, P4 family [Paenibacillus chibensis]
MKQNGTSKNQSNKDIPLIFGNEMKSGIYHPNEHDDEDKNANLWSGFLCNSQDKENTGILHIEHKKKSVDSTTKNISQRIPTQREESRTSLTVIPPKRSGSIKSPAKKLQHERSNEKKAPKRLSNHSLAEVLMNSYRFSVIENNLYYWNQTLGYHVGLTDKADIFVRQKIPEQLKGLITFKSSEEIIQWIKATDQLQVSEKDLIKRKEFVAFSNCVVKISDFSVHNHSPDYYFTSVINTEYPYQYRARGDTFENFMQQITDGDDSKYLRLQELFGYTLSEIRDVKAIPFLLGPKDSGKSIILKLLMHMVGTEFSSTLNFDEMNQSNFLCQLFGKKLNACGEVSELAINRLDIIKKLSGGDYVMARYLYSQAFKFINKAVLLFAGNHLPIIKGNDRSNAFSERLVIFPFNFQVPKERQDIYLFEKLVKEAPYIAQWSLIGLKRWCQNNYQFTTCDEIENLSNNYSEQNNSILAFVNSCCIFDPEVRIHNDDLESAYKMYCRNVGIIEESNKAFHKCLKLTNDLRYTRFRFNGDNKFGYIGIGLRSEFNDF